MCRRKCLTWSVLWPARMCATHVHCPRPHSSFRTYPATLSSVSISSRNLPFPLQKGLKVASTFMVLCLQASSECQLSRAAAAERLWQLAIMDPACQYELSKSAYVEACLQLLESGSGAEQHTVMGLLACMAGLKDETLNVLPALLKGGATKRVVAGLSQVLTARSGHPRSKVRSVMAASP